MSDRCDCGAPAKYHPLITLKKIIRVIDLCPDCYALEFPEKAAAFELARRNPTAGEFQDDTR